MSDELVYGDDFGFAAPPAPPPVAHPLRVMARGVRGCHVYCLECSPQLPDERRCAECPHRLSAEVADSRAPLFYDRRPSPWRRLRNLINGRNA